VDTKDVKEEVLAHIPQHEHAIHTERRQRAVRSRAAYVRDRSTMAA